MPMTFDDARSFALSLPGTSEEPHFDKLSWRVDRKIFATVPPDSAHLHIFVDEAETRASVEEDPVAFEELWWGKKLVGTRVNLAGASSDRVEELLEEAWSLRAPARLRSLRDLDSHKGAGFFDDSAVSE